MSGASVPGAKCFSFKAILAVKSLFILWVAFLPVSLTSDGDDGLEIAGIAINFFKLTFKGVKFFSK